MAAAVAEVVGADGFGGRMEGRQRRIPAPPGGVVLYDQRPP